MLPSEVINAVCILLGLLYTCNSPLADTNIQSPGPFGFSATNTNNSIKPTAVLKANANRVAGEWGGVSGLVINKAEGRGELVCRYRLGSWKGEGWSGREDSAADDPVRLNPINTGSNASNSVSVMINLPRSSCVNHAKCSVCGKTQCQLTHTGRVFVRIATRSQLCPIPQCWCHRIVPR